MDLQEKLILETRPCKDCAQYKRLHDGSICMKLLMGVTADMLVNFYASKGTCFEEVLIEKAKALETK